MKKLIHLLTAFILLAMIACSSDDESSSPVSGESMLKMNIDGMYWEADSYIVIGQSETDGTYNFTLSGRNSSFNGSSSSISAIFSVSEDDITAGTYELSGSGAGATVNGINGGTYMGGWITNTSFTIVITEVSGSGSGKKFKGTFSGTLKGATSDDIITVTNGEFSNF